MCGIFGYKNLEVREDVYKSLMHRGPDAYGQWEKGSINLSHCRLSIIDLSTNANQPFHNKNNSIHLVTNGEIYNYQEIRNELIAKGYSFNSDSDSEVILYGYEEWGIEVILSKLNGMFAFVIYDENKDLFICARDRIGIKPFYYYHHNDKFAFSSELSNLKDLIPYKLEINDYARDSYFSFGYIPGELSIYQDCFKLLPGHYLTFNKSIEIKKYWSPSLVTNSDLSVESIHEKIKQSVKNRLISDRPIGTFLSGGIDSSLITAISADLCKGIKSFSIGFDYGACNESEYAKKIAGYLGTEHYNLFCSEKDALNIVPQIPNIFGEPFADISAIPTFLLSKLVREHVVVGLSGDGGDELALGYNHYAKSRKMEGLLNIPGSRFGISTLAKFANNSRFFKKLLKISNNINRGELTFLISSINRVIFYKELFGNDFNYEKSYWSKLASGVEYENIDELLAYIELNHYMTEDILAKVDRCSMQHALEVRVPLLDHNIVESMLSLSRNMKVKDGETKWILKEILGHYIPRDLWERPKQGFTPPMGEWLNGPLNTMMHDYLSETSLKKEGLFNIGVINRLIDNHEHKRENNQDILWSLLVWEMWKESNL